MSVDCICAGDHTAWDQEEITEMLDVFVNITEAITLPDLKEYYWRNDKVADLLAIMMTVSAATGATAGQQAETPHEHNESCSACMLMRKACTTVF